MKKHLLIFTVALALCGYKTKAQVQYPIIGTQEDDFEVWSPDPANGTIKDPNSGSFGVACWETLNPMTYGLLGGSPQTVFQDSTVVHSGSYSARIVSQVLTPSSYALVKAFIPRDTVGVVLTATMQVAPTVKIVQGAPFTKDIRKFQFWYQYAPQMNNSKPDTAFCLIVLTHKHNVTGGAYVTMNAAASWTMVSGNITWDSAIHNVDTIQVFFSSSSLYKPAPLSQLIIDGFQPLDVNDLVTPIFEQVTVYPNPASSQVNFKVGGHNAYTLQVYDITGKEISTGSFKDNLLSLNTSSFPTGLYLYKLSDKQGALIKTGKFSVAR